MTVHDSRYIYVWVNSITNLPRIVHENRSKLNDDTLQRGKGVLERAKKKRQSGGAAKLHKQRIDV